MNEALLKKLKKASHWDKEDIARATNPVELTKTLWEGMRAGLWAEYREGSGKMREEQSLLLEHPSGGSPSDFVTFANLLGKDASSSGGHIVYHWSEQVERALTQAIDKHGDAFLSLASGLSKTVQQQLEVAQMIRGDASALSDATLDELLRGYRQQSTIWEGGWLHTHRDAIPVDRLARALARSFDDGEAIQLAELLERCWPHLDDAERVAALVRYDRDDRRGFAMTRLRAMEGARALVEAEMDRLEALEEAPRGSLANAAYYLAHLALDAGEAVPARVDERLRYFRTEAGDLELDRRLFAALDPARAGAILSTSVSGAADLLPVVEDEALLDAAVKQLDQDYAGAFADKVGAVGPRVLPALTRGLEGKPSVHRAAHTARALGHIHTPESAGLLVEILGHSSKVAREAAQLALGKLGETARPALEAGAQAKKKAVRTACTEMLELLEASDVATDSPLGAVQERFAAMDPAVVKGIVDGIPAQSHELKPYAEAQVKEHGPEALLAVREWYFERYKRSSYEASMLLDSMVDPLIGFTHATTRLYEPGNEASERARLEAAFVYLDLLAQLPKMKKYMIRTLLRDTPKRFGAWAAPAAAMVLETRKTALAAVFYDIAAKAPDATAKVLVDGLSETAKSIQDVCIEALASQGEAVVDRITPLLSAKKKPPRLAAAQVLARIGSAKALPALRKAYESESSEDVQMALDDAIRAAGGDPTPESGPAAALGEPASNERTAADWVGELTSKKAPRLPKWLAIDALPPLRLKSGAALDETAVAGLLGRLKKEHERPDPVAWGLRPHLDDASAAAFGKAVFDAWQRSGGKAADKWALYQMGLFADDAWVHATAPRLDNLSSAGKHAYAGWVLDVFARLGTDAGRNWIGYWADHALTDGLMRKADDQVGALAKAAGIDLAAMRARMNPFIAEEQAEKAVPTFGFDRRGEQKVSYGSREITIRLGLDATLQVIDDAGKNLKAMPAARKDDDAEKVAQAKRLFSRLADDAPREVRRVVRRLERAMQSGRTWDVPRFREVFVDHPIVGTVASSIVFVTDAGLSLRLSEEYTPIDAAGDDVTLPDDAKLRVAHPLDLSDAELAAWGEHLSESEVIQPFPQVGRPVYRVTDAIEIPKDKIKPTTFVARVREAGWNRGRPEDAGWVNHEWMRMPARRVNIELHHSGYIVSDASWGDEVRVESISFTRLAGPYLKPEDVDPIAFSEAHYAVMCLFESVPSREAASAPAKAHGPAKTAGGTTQRAVLDMGDDFPSADHAPTARAKCMHCDQKIDKGTVRIIIEREIDTPRYKGKGPGYMHPACAEKFIEAHNLDIDEFAERLVANTGLEVEQVPEAFRG